MTYKWKLPALMPIDAQSAGTELNRIYRKRGAMTPQDIVDESREESAPLHPCFEWRDDVAAEQYREIQAGNIIRNIAVVQETTNTPKDVRAFVSVQKSYHPIEVVLNDEEKASELLRMALRELQAFKDKYNTLSALKPVFDAINMATH